MGVAPRVGTADEARRQAEAEEARKQRELAARHMAEAEALKRLIEEYRKAIGLDPKLVRQLNSRIDSKAAGLRSKCKSARQWYRVARRQGQRQRRLLHRLDCLV